MPRNSRLLSFLVLLGFVFLLVWIILFYDKTFVPISLILAILLVPGLLLTPFLYKKWFPVALGSASLRGFFYVVVYALVTVPLGNTLVLLFFMINTYTGPDAIRIVTLPVENVGQSRSHKKRVRNRYYTHYELTYQGYTKRFKAGNAVPDSLENRTVTLQLKAGGLGFSHIVSSHFSQP